MIRIDADWRRKTKDTTKAAQPTVEARLRGGWRHSPLRFVRRLPIHYKYDVVLVILVR